MKLTKQQLDILLPAGHLLNRLFAQEKEQAVQEALGKLIPPFGDFLYQFGGGIILADDPEW